MDPPDDDIEFDFFEDEPQTGESAQSASRVRLPRAPGRKPRRPAGPPRGAAPLLRLLGLVVFVVVLMLLFALFIASCSGTSRHSAYAAYMTKVDTIARASTSNGKTLATDLATPGIKLTDLVTKLNGLASQERQNVVAAESLSPPGRLRAENGHLVEALELRASGIAGLAKTFAEHAKASNASGLLAEAGDRLLASDVVWDDLFMTPTSNQLATDGVTGVSVPESHSISSADSVSAHQMSLVLQRINGATTGGTVTGIHGTNIVSVQAVAGTAKQTLTAGSLNTVTTGTDLEIAVTVEDSGDSQEVKIPVSLTITGPPEIVMHKTIVTINPGDQQVVTFTGLGAVQFGRQVQLTVDVKKVPGEVNLTNNTATFPVIFSLPA
ncbi:MAG TPA: hypothetical protein VG652_00280 [Gaiellaceae bacterium]|nr:hypothetical protein [Gaiellaceae bacterium]